MNSILRRAPGKDMAPRPRRQSLLTRGTWKNLLALAVVALLSAASAYRKRQQADWQARHQRTPRHDPGAYSQPGQPGRA